METSNANGSKKKPTISDIDWKLFQDKGRPSFDVGDILWCIITFENDSTFYFGQRGGGSEHAEHRALFRIVDVQKTRYRLPIRSLTMYSNCAPCGRCAVEMLEFLNVRPQIRRFDLVLTSMFQNTEHLQHESLEVLFTMSPRVMIRVFTTADWQHLNTFRRDPSPMTEEYPARVERETWDALWAEQLSVLESHVLGEREGRAPLLSNANLVREQECRVDEIMNKTN